MAIKELKKDVLRGNLLSLRPLMEEELEELKERLTQSSDFQTIRFLQGQCCTLKEYIKLLNKTRL